MATKKEYLLKRKRIAVARKIFYSGINIPFLVLTFLKEEGSAFLVQILEDLPNFYPGIAIFKNLYFCKKNKFKPKFKKETIKININRLKRQGLIQEDKQNHKYFLTKEGEEILNYVYNRSSILRKKWDGKIRIVIFDVPEKKRRYREWLRQELLLLDFKPLQKSVYIGKLPLPEDFYRDILDMGLEKDIFIFTVDEIDKPEETMHFLEKG